MKLCEDVAVWLAENGFRRGFGIVGGGNVHLWDALCRLGETDIVCMHHEQAAAQAATFYARTCGEPALCLVTTGAGSTNALTGVLAALFDYTPLLVISGNEPYPFVMGMDRVKGTQGFRTDLAVVPFVVRSYVMGGMPSHLEIDNLDALWRAARKYQGPVWCDIPKDVQTKGE